MLHIPLLHTFEEHSSVPPILLFMQSGGSKNCPVLHMPIGH